MNDEKDLNLDHEREIKAANKAATRRLIARLPVEINNIKKKRILFDKNPRLYKKFSEKDHP